MTDQPVTKEEVREMIQETRRDIILALIILASLAMVCVGLLSASGEGGDLSFSLFAVGVAGLSLSMLRILFSGSKKSETETGADAIQPNDQG